MAFFRVLPSLKTIVQLPSMHGHEAELLTTTFLMLSAIGCGLVLKLVKQLISYWL
jgi:hypothetical protein